MSNEVSIFRDQTSITPITQRGIDEVTRKLLGSGSSKRISLRGSKFRMVIAGQEVARSSEPKLDVVIVNAASHVGRQYYAKAYNPDIIGAPDCWSNDGVKPDKKAQAPQSAFCEGCPKNIKGSGTNGGRACSFLRRLAVIMADSFETSDVYQLQLPATSIFGKGTGDHMGLSSYVKHLTGHGRTVTSIVTELRFDPDSEYPKLYFYPVRDLTDDEWATVQEKGQSQEAIDAITYDPQVIATKEPTPAPVAFQEPTVKATKKAAPPTPSNTSSTEDTLNAWAQETDD